MVNDVDRLEKLDFKSNLAGIKENISSHFKNYHPLKEITNYNCSDSLLTLILEGLRKRALKEVFTSCPAISLIRYIACNTTDADVNKKKFESCFLDNLLNGKLGEEMESLFIFNCIDKLKNDNLNELDSAAYIAALMRDFVGLSLLIQIDINLRVPKKDADIAALLWMSELLTKKERLRKQFEKDAESREKKSAAGKKSAEARSKAKNEGYKLWKNGGLYKLQAKYALMQYKSIINGYNVKEETVKNSWFSDYRKWDKNSNIV